MPRRLTSALTTEKQPDRRAKGGKWKPRFIAELSQRGNVTAACRKAKISREAAYVARDSDPVFKAAWEEALDIACDELEAEAIRRAKDGVLEPMVSSGKLVTRCRKYSDVLLIFLLKAHRPNKYRERVSVDSFGVPPEWLEELTDDELELVEKGKLSPTQIATIVAQRRKPSAPGEA